MIQQPVQRQHPTSERGQAIVLLALALVGLLGFTAVALDGGNIYTEQRRAQAAADNAVLSAAFERMNGTTDTTVLAARARASAAINGYDNLGDDAVAINRPPTQGYYIGNDEYIEVVITQTLQTALAHFVYQGPVRVTVYAVARGVPQQPPVAGYAIITLKDCKVTGVNNIDSTGGGNSGGVWAIDGGIWVNTTETAGGSPCALSPGSSANNRGITTTTNSQISSSGGFTYELYTKIAPRPIDVGANNGNLLPDPLAAVPEPTCTGNGSGAGSTANPYRPGRYGGSGQPDLGAGYLLPGIYCITGDVHLSGNSDLYGDGVLLYMIDGELLFTGNGDLLLTGPSTDFCLGDAPATTASCTYAGLVIFGARNHCGTVVDARGNGYVRLYGTVYAPCGTYKARGGGNYPEEWEVRGQLIVGNVLGNGNGSFIVVYDDNAAFNLERYVQMVQ